MSLRGWPVATISRGELIAENGEMLSEPGRGKYLPRKAKG
jgi:dihydropyrimidinase